MTTTELAFSCAEETESDNSNPISTVRAEGCWGETNAGQVWEGKGRRLEKVLGTQDTQQALGYSQPQEKEHSRRFKKGLVCSGTSIAFLQHILSV